MVISLAKDFRGWMHSIIDRSPRWIKVSSSFNCIACVLDMVAYRGFNFFQASWEVFDVAMSGVIEEDVEARIALKISLSYRTQWDLCNSSVGVAAEEGHRMVPST